MLVPPAVRDAGPQPAPRAAHRRKPAAARRRFVWPNRFAVARMIRGMISMRQDEEHDDEKPA
jgi:hypothetical protein